MQPKKFAPEELPLIDQRFMYEKLGRSNRPEYTASFSTSFEFVPAAKADLLVSFREVTEQPYNNIFMDYSIDAAIATLRSALETNRETVDGLVAVAFAVTDRVPAAGLPSSPQRLTALKQLYDLVLGGFLTLSDNVASMIATNLSAYSVIELLGKLLAKESVKMEEGLLAFETDERGFSYEESELRLRSHFDRVCGSRARFLGELVKLKKLEMYFCMDPEELALAAQGQTSRSLTSQDLADTVAGVVEAIANARNTLLEMIEAAKGGTLTQGGYRDPREVFEGVFGVLGRSAKRLQSFQLECCLSRESLFDTSLDRAAYVSNLLLTKITALEVLIFVRVAETALLYNLELAVKQQTNTLTAFHKVFDTNFDPKDAEEIVAEVKRDVIMLRNRLSCRQVSESEFANASVAPRVAKLFARIANLEKHNLRNERELAVYRVLGAKALAYVKLARDVENIVYNEQNETYLKINLQSIRKLDRARNDVEAALEAFEPIDSVLLQKLRDHVEKNRALLDQKAFEFSNTTLIIKFA